MPNRALTIGTRGTTAPRRRGACRVVAALVAGAALGILEPSAASAADEPAPARANAATTRPSYRRVEAHYVVPDVTLVDADGAPTSLRREVDGATPVLVNFVFTSCTSVCPILSGIFADVQRMLATSGDDVRLVSISLDPEHDTPAVLKAYAARLHAEPRWRWLTGTRQDAIAAARAFGAWPGDKVNHAPATYLRVAPGTTWVRVEGFATAADLVEEYRRLRAGASGAAAGG